MKSETLARQDFDGGFVGQQVSQALSSMDPGGNGIYWEVVPASQFPNGIAELEDAIVDEKTWYGFTSAFVFRFHLTAAKESGQLTPVRARI